MSIDLILNGLQQGLILAIVAYGVMIPFRFLDFADLTAEGAYPFGGAICAVCITSGAPPVLAILLSVFGAGILGICTSLVHLKLRANSMLAGIILSAMAYSVNLRIMERPNIALFDCAGLFGANIICNMLIIMTILAICVVLFAVFLRTECGPD